ncbi:MAG: glycerophosphodiester phosphodiesterase family protein [Cellvibrionales bacterium]|nr:glycerophosphodiester phosphodiesterase family protein [Cellvibrionales bacterium]
MGIRDKRIEQVIAHRGLQRCFPENTSMGIQAALESGVRNIEVDIQFSKDGEPILYHDSDCMRLSGRAERVEDLSITELLSMPKYEPDRFRKEYIKNTIEPLDAIIPFFMRFPDAHFFIELKDEAIAHQGLEYCLAKIMMVLAKFVDRLTLIAFSEEAVWMAKSAFHFQNTGLVLSSLVNAAIKCEDLKVDIAFINSKFLNDELPTLPCPIALYEIPDAETAEIWLKKGAAKIESFCSDQVLSGLLSIDG